MSDTKLADLAALAAVTTPANLLFYVVDLDEALDVNQDKKAAMTILDSRFATAAQGALAATALQNAAAFATAAQGVKADSALQAAAIGVSVQAYDAGLASIAGLTTAADKMIYTTALDTYAVADLSAFGRSLIDDANAAAALTTLTAAGTGVANTFTAAQLIDGSADAIQLAVEAAASQTVPLMTWQASGGGVRSSIDPTAYGWRVGDAAARGNISIGAGANNNNMAIQIDRIVSTPVASVYGVSGEMNIAGTATIAVVAGLSFSAKLTHTSGTVTNAYGVDTLVRNTSTGIAASMTGVRIQAGINSGGGTVGTLYGLRIMDQTVGGTNYAIQTGLGLVEFGDRARVKQPGAAAAQPVVYLEQLDIDQPMIELATTIGTGNAIEAVGAKTLTATHFIMVKLPGGLTRYFPVGTIA